MLNQICIAEVNSTYSRFFVLFTHFCIWLFKNLLRIFAPMFMRALSFQFTFLVMVLPVFSIRIILASQNVIRKSFLLFNFWKNLDRICPSLNSSTYLILSQASCVSLKSLSFEAPSPILRFFSSFLGVCCHNPPYFLFHNTYYTYNCFLPLFFGQL